MTRAIIDRPTTPSAGHSDVARQEYPVNTHGIRGMDVTTPELRAAGTALAAVALRGHDRLTDLNDKGALTEALLAIGAGTEPTVRGAVARHVFLTGPERPLPVASLADPTKPVRRR